MMLKGIYELRVLDVWYLNPNISFIYTSTHANMLLLQFRSDFVLFSAVVAPNLAMTQGVQLQGVEVANENLQRTDNQGAPNP